VSTQLGLCHGGTSYGKVQARARELELDASHFRGQGWSKDRGTGRKVELDRAAKKRYYDSHLDVYRARNTRRRQERMTLIARLKDVPCWDCGSRFPSFVMEFDHREDAVKDFNISSRRHYVSVARLMAEVAKCDVVCVLCHRFRTARRAGWDEGRLDSAAALADLAADE